MIHEDEILGKAYDARLMRRLIGYLRPYTWQAAGALAAIIANSFLQLGQPYLTKLAIDQYIAQRDLSGLDWIALAFLGMLVGSFALEYVQTYTMQLVGQRIMYDLRMQIFAHLQRARPALLRPESGRPAHDARHERRRRAQRAVHSAASSRSSATSSRSSASSPCCCSMDWRLALRHVLGAAAHRPRHAWFRATCATRTGPSALWLARINAFLQERITGMASVQLFRREAASLPALRRDQPRPPGRQPASRSSTTPSSSRPSRSSARSRLR